MVSSTPHWHILPTEIRFMILESLAKNGPGSACYASVCREWQQAIEPIVFREIRIIPARLPYLFKIVHPRRALLERINFHVELQGPNVPRRVREGWTLSDISMVKICLHDLLVIFDRWKSSDRHLTLEIDITGPNDLEDPAGGLFHAHESYDMEIHGQQVSLPLWRAMHRHFFYIGLHETFWYTLLQVVDTIDLKVSRNFPPEWQPFLGYV